MLSSFGDDAPRRRRGDGLTAGQRRQVAEARRTAVDDVRTAPTRNGRPAR